LEAVELRHVQLQQQHAEGAFLGQRLPAVAREPHYPPSPEPFPPSPGFATKLTSATEK
jgi:hypothetical protein